MQQTITISRFGCIWTENPPLAAPPPLREFLPVTQSGRHFFIRGCNLARIDGSTEPQASACSLRSTSLLIEKLAKTIRNSLSRLRLPHRSERRKYFLEMPLINFSMGLLFALTGILYTKHQMSVSPSNGISAGRGTKLDPISTWVH
jgi:hypothetical protein